MRLAQKEYLKKTALATMMLASCACAVAQDDTTSVDDSSSNVEDVVGINNSAWLDQERMEKEEMIADRQWNYALTGMAGLLALIALVCYYMKSKKLRKLNIHNEQLIMSLEQAERASQIKSVFIQNMSHEIRTPLNAICGFAQILSDPDMAGFLGDEEKEEYRRIITNNTSFLSVLIDDILDISELKTGRYKMNIAECSLYEVCQDSMDLVKLQVPDGVSMHYETTLDKSFKFNTDYYRTKQVLTNLLSNACQHTKEGDILLKTESFGQGVRFIVQDTGSGIDPNKAEEIFDSYSRIDTYKQGSGLGLTICRNIANALKGKVYLDTTYTEGARFIFEI